MARPSPGQLRERIALQFITTSPDTGQDATEVVAATDECWARMEPRGVDTIQKGEREVARQRFRCSIRTRAGVMDGQRAPERSIRVSWRGRSFDLIGGANEDEGGMFIIMSLIERDGP